MDHSEALKLAAVEKYLLQELPAEQRDAFEEHYFDCQECAADLRATAAFMEAAKNTFKTRPVARAPGAKSRFTLLRSPAILAWALAASLLVIGYQNVFVYRHTQGELAKLELPAILPAVSLVGGNSRGSTTPSVLVHGDQSFLLSLDIPAQPQFTSYTCQLYSPAGVLIWSVQVSAQMAKDTVTINAPPGTRAIGTYTVAVVGSTGQGTAVKGTELARYSFNLAIQPS